MTVANALRGRERRQFPRYVGVNPVDKYDGFAIAGPDFLGHTFSVFPVVGDPSKPDFALLEMGEATQRRARFKAEWICVTRSSARGRTRCPAARCSRTMRS